MFIDLFVCSSSAPPSYSARRFYTRSAKFLLVSLFLLILMLFFSFFSNIFLCRFSSIFFFMKDQCEWNQLSFYYRWSTWQSSSIRLVIYFLFLFLYFPCSYFCCFLILFCVVFAFILDLQMMTSAPSTPPEVSIYLLTYLFLLKWWCFCF